jgi:hypothetical protein
VEQEISLTVSAGCPDRKSPPKEAPRLTDEPEVAILNAADLEMVRKFIEKTNIDAISDNMRFIVEQYLPDFKSKLPRRG